MTIFLLALVLGIAIGAFGFYVVQEKAPGRPVAPYEQAVLKGTKGGIELVNGPAWLSVHQNFNLLGVYDVSDRRMPLVVEPAYCIAAPDGDPNFPRQRFYAEMMIVYRPLDMNVILQLGDEIEPWLESRVKTALRTASLSVTWDLFDDGTFYAGTVFNEIAGPAMQHGIEIREVVVERLGTRTPNEIEARAQAGRARTLGRDGLVLQYLKVLEKLAESPSTTVVLPSDLEGDPAKILRHIKS